jgi:hypothetical protein
MKWGWVVIERASDPIRVMDAVTMCTQIRQHGLDVRCKARQVDAMVVVLTGCADDSDVDAGVSVEVPTVLVDLRESPALPIYRAPRWFPEAVVTERTAFAVAYGLAMDAPIWATTLEPDHETTDEVLLCTGRLPSSWESTINDVLSQRSEALLVTGERRHEVADLLSHGAPNIRVANGNEWFSLGHERPKLVILLPSSPIVPDLALALGHAVASDRAPVGVDWWLVPTLDPRTFAGRSAVTVTDVLDDHVLRNWLASVCAAGIRARVRLRPLIEAVVEAMQHVEQRWAKGASWAVASWLQYLDDGDLALELTRLNAARDVGGRG